MQQYAQSLALVVVLGGAAACGSTSEEVLGPRDASALESAADVGADRVTDAGSGETGCPDGRGGTDCGSCPRDCLGGACTNGACQPVVIAHAPAPFSVVLDDARVYWVSVGPGSVWSGPGEIWSVKKDGTDLRMVATGLDGPQAVFADSSNLFWTELNAGRLWRADRNGANAIVIYDRGAGGAFNLVADATSVYWVDYYQSQSIQKVPRGAGPDAGVPTIVAANQRYPFGIAQDANNIYWSDREGSFMGPLPDGGIPGRIWMAPKDGSSSPVLLATDQANPFHVAVDATSLYWVDNGSGSVMRLRFGETTPTEVLHVSAPYGVAVDNANVYVTSLGEYQGDGKLLSVPKGGGAAFVMASGLPGPTRLAVDDTAVYWANHYGGTVMKIAK